MVALRQAFADSREAGQRAVRRRLALRHARVWLIVATGLITWGVAPAVTRADWPQSGFNAAHTGYNPTESAITPSNVATLKLAWQTGADVGSTHAGPAVANGRVYLAADNGTLYAFPQWCGTADATCEPAWEDSAASIGDSVSGSSSAAVSGDSVFVVSSGGELLAFPASSTGSTCMAGTPAVCAPTWDEADEESIFSLCVATGSPTVAGNQVYVGGAVFLLVYLPSGVCSYSDAGTGKKTLLSPDGITGLGSAGPFLSTPAVAGGRVFAAGQGQVDYFPNLCVPDVDDGVVVGCLGASPWQVAGVSSPVIDQADGVFFETTAGSLVAYSLKTGAQEWSAAIPGTGSAASPSVANGVVYVGQPDPQGSSADLYAFASAGCGASTCAPLWSGTTTGSQITVSPTVGGGVVYVGTSGGTGELDAFAAAGCGSATCLPLYKFSLPAGVNVTTPASVTNRSVYFGTDSSTAGLYALSLPGL